MNNFTTYYTLCSCCALLLHFRGVLQTLILITRLCCATGLVACRRNTGPDGSEFCEIAAIQVTLNFN